MDQNQPRFRLFVCRQDKNQGIKKAEQGGSAFFAKFSAAHPLLKNPDDFQ
ncbi:hypothetical protein [Ligilactobacillus ruminis]|nr:hypothetical protein [Ligilactobacillus ruminis]